MSNPREWWIKNGMAYEREPEAGSWSYHVVEVSRLEELSEHNKMLSAEMTAAHKIIQRQLNELNEARAEVERLRDFKRQTEVEAPHGQVMERDEQIAALTAELEQAKAENDKQYAEHREEMRVAQGILYVANQERDRLAKALERAKQGLHYYAKCAMLSDSPARLTLNEVERLERGQTSGGSD